MESCFRNGDGDRNAFCNRFWLAASHLSVLQGPKEGFLLFLQYVFCHGKKIDLENENDKRISGTKPTLTVPIAWMVKAHVIQAISGTRGHSSLGAVCSPTLWTVVAHTPSISIMLSENFILNQRGTENSDCYTMCLGHSKSEVTASLTVPVLRSSG